MSQLNESTNTLEQFSLNSLQTDESEGLSPAQNLIDEDEQFNSQNVRTLFLSNLPLDTTRREIYLLFRDQIGYSDCTLRQKQGSPPCAFVTFQSHENALDSMSKMQGIQFDPKDPESRIRIELAKNDTRRSLTAMTSNLNISSNSTANKHISKSITNHKQKRSRKNNSQLEKDNHSKRARLTGRDTRSPSLEKTLSSDVYSIPTLHMTQPLSQSLPQSHIAPSNIFSYTPTPSIPFHYLTPHYLTNTQFHFDPIQVPPNYFIPHFGFQPQGFSSFYPNTNSRYSSLDKIENSQGSESPSHSRAKRRRKDFDDLQDSFSDPQSISTLRVNNVTDSQEKIIEDLASNLKGFLHIQKEEDKILIYFESDTTALKASEILQNIPLRNESKSPSIDFIPQNE